jgi:hypothetical protein
VHGDLCGSDHFPVVLEPSVSLPEEHIPRWKFSKADWLAFSSLCSDKLTYNNIAEEPDLIQAFSDILSEIATETIPKTTANPKLHKPWFNDTCKAAIKCRKKSERKFNKHPTPWNLDNCRKSRAKARRTVNTEKRQSWRGFVSKINSRTPINKVWNMISKIKGKGTKTTVQHLKVDDNLLTSKLDIANTLAETISKNSSSANYVPAFQKYQKQQEKRKVNFDSDNSEDYNEPFSLSELHTALSKAHCTLERQQRQHSKSADFQQIDARRSGTGILQHFRA